jgi:hypothetical protein
LIGHEFLETAKQQTLVIALPLGTEFKKITADGDQFSWNPRTKHRNAAYTIQRHYGS